MYFPGLIVPRLKAILKPSTSTIIYPFDYCKENVRGDGGLYSMVGCTLPSGESVIWGRIAKFTAYPGNTYKIIYTYFFLPDGAGSSERYTQECMIECQYQSTTPSISGTDGYIGSKSKGFGVNYTITNEDSYTYTVKVYLNDVLFDTKQTVKDTQYTINVPDSLVLALQLNSTNKLKIEVTGGYDVSAIYRNYTFTKSNNSPQIVLNKISNNKVKYIVSDLDNNLNKIEVFLDNVLKETITIDLYLEKTCSYILEDNAIHTVKIKATDAYGASEKLVSISKEIQPPQEDASLQDIASTVSIMKNTFVNGKSHIVSKLALKNINATLDNTLVEMGEMIGTAFNSADVSVQDLQNQLTIKNNIISQLNTQISNMKMAKGIFTMTTRLSSYAIDAGFNIYNHNKTEDKVYFIEVSNLAFTPDLIILEYNSWDNSKQYTICSFSESPGTSRYYFLELYSLISSNIRTEEFKRVTKRDYGYFKIPICIFQSIIEQQYQLEGKEIKWTALQL